MADEKKKPDVEETPQDENPEEKASDDKQADENGSTILKTKQTHTKRKILVWVLLCLFFKV